jgi:hypothetical protein
LWRNFYVPFGEMINGSGMIAPSANAVNQPFYNYTGVNAYCRIWREQCWRRLR